MLQSKLFTKTLKDAPKDEVSLNAALLTRAGFIGGGKMSPTEIYG